MNQLHNKEIKHTGHCIICHEDNVEVSDEHVIPKSIGGYYHIYSVCKVCNSKFGELVDNHLTNHFIMQSQRHVNKLIGNSGKIPNPLIGDGVMENGTKVRLEENETGQIVPYMLPEIKTVDPDGKSFKIIVDKKDEKLINKITKKIKKRIGLKEDVQYKTTQSIEYHTIENPVISKEVSFDLNNYKIGILKIAYEFAVDKIPSYYSDPKARLYAQILHEAALDRLAEVDFLGDALLNASFQFLEDYIDYSNTKRHILSLFNCDGKLYCMVKLFNNFICQIICMSDHEYDEIKSFYIATNDFEKNECKFYSTEELLAACVKGESKYVKFSDKDNERFNQEIQSATDSSRVGFACNINGDNIIFDKDGKSIMTQTSLVNYLEQSDLVSTANIANGNVDTYSVPNEYYLMLMPSRILMHPLEFIYTNLIQKL